MEIIGFRGAPELTLKALQDALKNTHFPSLIVTLVTDWQDQRDRARYALFIRGPKTPILTEDAFGPAFGEAGRRALAEAVAWLEQKGVRKFYEAVLPPSEYQGVFDLEPEEAYRRLVASANPTDTAIYSVA